MMVGLVAMFMLSQVFVACMGDDETVLTPECGIVSFKIASFKSQVTEKKYNAKGESHDTIVTRTISGDDVFFNIDHYGDGKTGRIYAVNPLPHWANLSRLVPSFTSYGNVVAKISDDGLFYPITSGKDSVDISKPLEIACISTDGKSAKYYKVEIAKHTESLDTLEWKNSKAVLGMESIGKAVACGNRVFLFGMKGGKTVVTSSGDAIAWDDAEEVSADIDIETVAVWKGAFYANASDGTIYTSAAGKDWTVASDTKVERVLCGDSRRLYAKNGGAIMGTADLATWKAEGKDDMEMLPDACVYSTSRTSKTNSDIETVVMTGLCSANANNGVAWYKVTADDEEVNQSWTYIEVTKENEFGLPRLANLSVTDYNGSLYAIGTEGGKYSFMYRSDDYGIAWHALTKKYLLPAELSAAEGKAMIVTLGDRLCIIQENGNVWQGSIR